MKIIVWKDIWNYTFNAVAKTITFYDLPTINIRDVVLITNVTDNIIIYNFADVWFGGTITSQVLTLDYDTATMDNADDLQVILDIWDPTIDQTLALEKVAVQNPEPSYFQQREWRDGTNLPIATNYYPSALWISADNYKNISLTWKMIDADGTMTLTVEATNDEDQTNADWIQIYMFDDLANAKANTRTITNWTLTFALSYANFNYQYYRIKMVNNGATNTFILKGRMVY